ncbi:MAG: hypothetical protein GC186_02075 [Rhodobacteraceae bacterium]|nr:hypothetical protein [Paracoccaceae bacterium]
MSIVVVVGAGASKEFNLPTGAELVDHISRFCKVKQNDFGDLNITNQILSRSCSILSAEAGTRALREQYIRAADHISKNMPLAPSIDNFLHTRRADPEVTKVGKLAIAATILDAERMSLLHVPEGNVRNRPNFDAVKKTWIASLFRVLITGRDFDGFLDALREIVFVSFNYDRCIYQYLVYAAISYFDVQEKRVRELFDAIEVIYPYGSLGPLEWLGANLVGFGSSYNERELLDISRGLNTFTEGSGTDRTIKISQAINNCRILIFLGFSFLDLNMELIGRKTGTAIDRVIATGNGLSEESRHTIRQELAQSFAMGVESSVELKDRTCFELFFDHHRYLERAF